MRLSNLGMERLHVDGRLHASVAAARTEHIGSSFLELCFPRRDLIGVDVGAVAAAVPLSCDTQHDMICVCYVSVMCGV